MYEHAGVWGEQPAGDAVGGERAGTVRVLRDAVGGEQPAGRLYYKIL